MKMLLKLKKAGTAFLAIGLLILSMSMPVFASSIKDMSKLGSITINTSGNNSNTSNSFAGIKFTIYKVANLSNSGDYILTNDFLNAGIQLDKLKTANEVASASRILASYVTTKNISGSSNVTNENGIVQFKDLTLGYYLVMQTIISSDQNNSIICDPFLIAVPMNTNDNKNWIYDIVAYPKCETALGTVILEKVNSYGTLLSGAVFRLEKKVYYSDTDKLPYGVQIGYDSNGKYYWNTLFSSLTTNYYGQIVVKNMPFAQYRFIETTAPIGYILDTTPHEFTISVSGSVALVNGKYITAAGTVKVITIYNSYYSYYYSPTPTPIPTPTLTPTPTPTLYPTPTKFAAVPTVTKTPKRIETTDNIPPDKKPPKKNIIPKNKHKGKVLPTNFDLPKTGGSKCYVICTYGGTVMMICGIVVFILSRKKRV